MESEKIRKRKIFMQRYMVFSRSNSLNLRIASLIVDILILAPVCSILFLPINYIILKIKYLNILKSESNYFIFFILLFSIVFVLYSSLMEASKHRSTVGQSFFGVRVKGTAQRIISFSSSLKRALLKLIVSPMLICFLFLFLFMEYIFFPFYNNIVEIKVEKRY